MKRPLLLTVALLCAGAAFAQVPADKVVVPVDKLQALKERLVKAAAKDTGLKLNPRASTLSRLRKQGSDAVAKLECADETTVHGRRYKGVYLPQPWDSQLLGKATLTYDILLVGADPEKGEIKSLNREMTMVDKACGQTWTFNFDSKTWELRDPQTKELKDAVELGKEYPCHLHVDLVPIYDNRTGPLYLGDDGRVRNSRYTTVFRKYITSVEDFQKIREMWLDRQIYTKNGEIIEVKPPQ